MSQRRGSRRHPASASSSRKPLLQDPPPVPKGGEETFFPTSGAFVEQEEHIVSAGTGFLPNPDVQDPPLKRNEVHS